MTPRRILVVAGEISGDLLAADLVRALRAREPDLEFFGIGGDALRAAGVEVFQDIAGMSVMGLTAVLRKINFFRRIFNRALREAAARKPDAAILVDYPGFNLRLAPRLQRLGMPVIYYVAPQVWAWHRGRARILARSVRRLLTLFPFEPALLKPYGVRADYVGHPLADAARTVREGPPVPVPWPDGEPRLALLPGSRPHEISRLLPDLLAAAAALQRDFPRLACLVAAPSEPDAAALRDRLARLTGPRPARLAVVGGLTRPVLAQARAACVASGTATLDAALQRCPMTVVYRTSWPTWYIGNLLVKVEHVGMVNLIAGRRLCPELLQNRLTPDSLAAAMRPLLGDTAARAETLAGLDSVIQRMDTPGAADRAADLVLRTLA